MLQLREERFADPLGGSLVERRGSEQRENGPQPGNGADPNFQTGLPIDAAAGGFWSIQLLSCATASLA